jgi:hypothetical protein
MFSIKVKWGKFTSFNGEVQAEITDELFSVIGMTPIVH